MLAAAVPQASIAPRLVDGDVASGLNFGNSPELADEVAGHPIVSVRQTSGGQHLSILK
jgi:hypothetical protein